MMTRTSDRVDGILNVNKPVGETSFALVALVKRLSGVPRVGHAGTLDPAACGVLPICLGQGTRLVPFLMAERKCYQAQMELGVTTDTDDASGQIIHRADPSAISRGQLESALASFCGITQQVPPTYSAVKYQGKPLYQLARAGIPVKRDSRPTQIYRLKLWHFQSPLATVEVECGKGTYIRSLARDLGQVLGCGASLKSLIRLRYGWFDISDAIPVPQLVAAFRYGYWPRLVYPTDVVLSHWAAMVVSDETGRMISHGRPVALGNSLVPSRAEERCRVYTRQGSFLGILHFDQARGLWQPERVFGPPPGMETV